MYFERFTIRNKKALSIMEELLRKSDLLLDPLLDAGVLAYNQDDVVIGCGGISGSVLKCIALDESLRGEGGVFELLTELIHFSFELGRTHLFIYTKPQYEATFAQCGFTKIESVDPYITLLENQPNRLKKELEHYALLKEQIGACGPIGGIVLNANPFTLGHRFLIERALEASEHVHLFIVGENLSRFTYEERFTMVQAGTSDLARLTLHPGSPYVLSRATFPGYFLKEAGIIDRCYMELDLRIFRRYIAPALGITHRFVGTEPLCPVTHCYNEAMRRTLTAPEMSAPAVQTVEIPRMTQGGEPVSASRVREFLSTHNWKEAVRLLPPTTYTYLERNLIHEDNQDSRSRDA